MGWCAGHNPPFLLVIYYFLLYFVLGLFCCFGFELCFVFSFRVPLCVVCSSMGICILGIVWGFGFLGAMCFHIVDICMLEIVLQFYAVLL